MFAKVVGRIEGSFIVLRILHKRFSLALSSLTRHLPNIF